MLDSTGAPESGPGPVLPSAASSNNTNAWRPGRTSANRSYGPRVQIIVADNNVPYEQTGPVPAIELTPERATIPGVFNAGVGSGRVEDVDATEG